MHHGQEEGVFSMQIVHEKITSAQLTEIAAALFGDMVKAVVDIEKNTCD